MAAKKKKSAKKKASTKKKAPPKKKKVTRRAAPAKRKAAARKPAKKASGRTQLAETVLQAITMTLISDGTVAPEEEALLRRIASEPLFRGVDARKAMKEAIQRCLKEGVDASLAHIAKRLPSKGDREAAFTTCVAAAATDGTVTSSEARLLTRIRDAFGISAARARQLAGPAAPALG